MSELERDLQALAAELRWPDTPALELQLEPRGRRSRRLAVALAVAALVAIAVALAVPGARSAILRAFRLGGVSVERVTTVPATPARPLEASLGPIVTRERAGRALGVEVSKLPTGDLHLSEGVVSVVLPRDRLLSELRTGPVPLIQKQLAGSGTHAAWSVVNGEPALWISGARHLVRFPDAPARLAGNVLVWQSRPITFRLEGPRLGRSGALAFARGT